MLHWTYDDWLNFPGDGWTYDIIGGVLYLTAPPPAAYENSLIALATRMQLYAEDNSLGKVLNEKHVVRLPQQAVPVIADIVFVRNEHHAMITSSVVQGAPDLVVELTGPPCRAYKRQLKSKLYQAAGVPEYWLVDYDIQTVEVFQQAHGLYKVSGRYTNGDMVESTQLTGFRASVKSFMKV